MGNMFKKNHKFIGTIKVGSINNFSRTCDIGIMIGDKTEWGKGYAQDSLKVVCNYLFQKLLIRKLNSGTMSINQPMIKTFLNLGFKKRGYSATKISLKIIIVTTYTLVVLKMNLNFKRNSGG